MKKLLTSFTLFLLVCGLFFAASTVHGQTVGNVISSDTTWATVNSPYTLTNSVTVSQGATLTIEPGVTVNIEQDATLK